MPTILDAHRVRVLGRDGARPIVFAHGLGCDQLMWRHLVPSFFATHQVVLFDHVGHGGAYRSRFDPVRHASLHGYADDLLAICEELDLRDAVLVGHSASATIATLAAGAQPERFSDLVLVAPSPRFVDDGDYVGGFSQEQIDGLIAAIDRDWERWAADMGPVIMGNPERPSLGAELTWSFCRTDPEVIRAFARATFLADHREDLARVATRTLVLQSAEDPIAPRTVGEYVHGAIAQSQLVVLDASGHCPHLSAPARTLAAIQAFLER